MFNLFNCISTHEKLSIYLSMFLCFILISFGCGSEDLSDYPPSNMRSIVRFTLNPAKMEVMYLYSTLLQLIKVKK